jgi:hypothetical protein
VPALFAFVIIPGLFSADSTVAVKLIPFPLFPLTPLLSNGKFQNPGRFPPFPRWVNPGQPLANKALLAQTAAAKPSSNNYFAKNTISRYSVTGVFPETVIR